MVNTEHWPLTPLTCLLPAGKSLSPPHEPRPNQGFFLRFLSVKREFFSLELIFFSCVRPLSSSPWGKQGRLFPEASFSCDILLKLMTTQANQPRKHLTHGWKREWKSWGLFSHVGCAVPDLRTNLQLCVLTAITRSPRVQPGDVREIPNWSIQSEKDRIWAWKRQARWLPARLPHRQRLYWFARLPDRRRRMPTRSCSRLLPVTRRVIPATASRLETSENVTDAI